jgi:hypothetical protein
MQPRLADDDGAVAVLVALLMVVVLGFTAVVVDVGAMYAAIAQECATGATSTCTFSAIQLARTMANGNANDGTADVENPEIVGKTVTVRTSEEVVHRFAPILGIDESDVGAQASASWGSPGAGPAMLPFTFAQCLFAETPENVERWIIYKDNKVISTCDPDGPPGGFGWLDSDAGKCSAQIDVANPELVGSAPGNSFDSACTATLHEHRSTPAMLPIYDSANGSGQNAQYRLLGFAAFKLTGWKFGGGGSSSYNDGAAAGGAKCTGDCRGVKGYFTKMVTLDEYLATAGATDFGTSIVKLTS